MNTRTLVSMGAALLVAAAAVAGTHTTSGTIYNQNKQWDKALVELRLALKEDPKDAKAHFQIGFSYSNLDSMALAYEHFMKARELEPKKYAKDVDDNIAHNYAQHYKLAQAAFAREDLPTAGHEFGMATQADPIQPAAHFNLAVVYQRMASTDSTYHAKTLAEADKVLELSKPSDPNYSKALQLSAHELVAMGREAEAVDRCKKFLEADPSKYPVVEEIGTDLYNSNSWKGAEALLKLAADERTKAGAEDFNVYFNIASAEFNQRKTDPAKVDEAIASYEKALTIQPDDAPTVFNLMMACVAKEDWTNAATWGEKYVSLSPNDAKAWQFLARCYSELGEQDKANDALARYQQLKG